MVEASVVGRVVRVFVLAMLFGARAVRAEDCDRGWGFLVDKLVHDGVPRERVLQVFRDDRVDEFDGLRFSLDPHESRALYRNLRTRSTAARAERCIERYRDAFEAAQQQFGVPANLVASIIQVESGCGTNTGRSRILPGLARLAMAAEPANLEQNIDRLTLLNPERSPTSVSSLARWRSQTLEDMFYPEVKATFEIAAQMQVDPLEIRGSGSGAFGIPQFLPRSYLWFGVDGDRDGRVSLYDPEDAIPSCARYLQHYGWSPEISRDGQRRVIWSYNHSDAYIDTVLWLADEVESPTPEPPKTAAKVTKGRPRAKKSSRRPTAKRAHVRH